MESLEKYNCVKCNKKYAVNSDGICEPFKTGGCHILESETVCLTCLPGYYYSDGLCPESDFSFVFIFDNLWFFFTFMILFLIITICLLYTSPSPRD